MSNDFYVPPRKNLIWLCVDLDGTLAWPTWEPNQKRSVIGDPISENVAKLRESVEHGYKAIIYTARPWTDWEMIEAWLELHEIPFKQIICGKPLVHRYIDDKGINAREDKWF